MATEKTKKISEENREKLVERILELMEKDGLSWAKGFDATQWRAKNEITPSRYRGVNKAWLAAVMLENHLSDPRWCTFNQAKANGWNVKKGSKATYVECYKEMPFTVEGGQRRWLKKREVEEMRAEGKEPMWQLCLASVAPVFNYADVIGPEPYVQEPGPSDYDGLIDALVASSRCPVATAAVKAACYRPDKDEIVMPPRAAYGEQARYASTLLHEMAHSTAKPLGRTEAFGQGGDGYALEELRAELACVFSAAELGLPLGSAELENHSRYLQAWLERCRNDKKAMTDAIADAQRIADYLIGNMKPAAA